MASPTGKPVRKVAAGGVAGAIVTIAVFVLKNFAKIDIPSEVASALTTVVTFLISYIVPPGADETVMTDVQGNVKSAKVAPAV